MQVVSKIIKHAGDVRTATGLLLGLDFDGTLEISNSFPLPHHSNDEDDKSSKATGAPSLENHASPRILIFHL
jgi:translation initiation factor 3 subunit H